MTRDDKVYTLFSVTAACWLLALVLAHDTWWSNRWYFWTTISGSAPNEMMWIGDALLLDFRECETRQETYEQYLASPAGG